MILFKQAELFAPEPLGRKDVLVAGTRIEAIADEIPEPKGLELEVISADGLRLIPGLIDGHVHIAGAGGEGGPATRTPELNLSQLVVGGITGVIGCLGTDGYTRSVESVLMKAKALRAEGVSAWIMTGSYQVPPPTLLGDVARDIAMIEECVGVGEVAIMDHRSSCPSVDELARLAKQARVGGMLGGKAGLVNLHMGDAEHPFRLLYSVIEQHQLKLKQFIPTHGNRNHWIFEDSKEYARNGYIDLTASSWPYFPDEEIKPSKAVAELLKAGVPIEHITLSSDGCGSLPGFDEHGNLVKIETGQPSSILREMLDMLRQEKLPLEVAVRTVSTNVAEAWRLPRKGRLRPGHDADLTFLDHQDRVYHVVAMGAFLMRDATLLRKGTFEG